tara:strand:+ start:69396 stop:69755 length:360 start_codon:yes stop_codon:yes gene_type:complete
MKITITGNSMYPSLESGDEITVNQTFSLQIGRIYIFQDADKKLICHRLIGDNLFKGDNSLLSDHVESKSVIGLATHRNDRLIAYKNARAIVYLSKLNSKEHWGGIRRIARALLLLFRAP